MASPSPSPGSQSQWTTGLAAVVLLLTVGSVASALGGGIGPTASTAPVAPPAGGVADAVDTAPSSSLLPSADPIPLWEVSPGVLGTESHEGMPHMRQADPAGSGESAATTDAAPAPAGTPVLRVQLEIQTREIEVLGIPTEIWTYNGHTPEIIRVTEGTRVEVTIVNGHSQTHSFHTHFRGNLIGSDGSSDTAPFPMVPHQHNPTPVEENPIGPYEPRHDRDVADPGQSYTYTFFADTPGNFIFHCHVFLATDHIERGLFGTFVVYPKGWTWEELPADDLNGKTKARVTDPRGREYFEDVVFMTELSPAALPNTGTTIPVGQPITSEYPTAVTTSGFTPAATGKIHLANYRAWNDPYIVGPARPNERVIIRVINLGDEMHDWHVHSHWFDIIDKTSHDWKPLLTDDTWLLGPGDSIMTMLTAGNPGYWFMHDHIVPEAYTGMVPWLLVEGDPVPNVPPDITVDTLVDGSVVAGRVVVLGTSDDFEGREMVRSVEVQVDGGDWQPVTGLLDWRTVWDTTALEDGQHTFRARSFDGRDHSELQELDILVRNDAGPAAPVQSLETEDPSAKLPALGVTGALAALGVVGFMRRRRPE